MNTESNVADHQLVEVLSGSIGEEKAREAIDEGVRSLGLNAGAMSREQALDLLETLATTPGIVGITARFGRSRLMLQWARDGLPSRAR